MMKNDVIAQDLAPTLDGLFLARIRRTPEAPAYRSFDKAAGRWVEIGWRQIGAQTARWQAALASEGLGAGDRVAVALRNCREWVCFDQAALGLGLVVVPLYTDDRPDNIAFILNDSGARVLLVQDAAYWRRLSPHLEPAGTLTRVLLLNPAPGQDPAGDPRLRTVARWLAAGPCDLAQRAGDPDALASIVYTSGTTGRPKGVMLSHRNMLSVAHAALHLLDVYPRDLFLSFLPLSHTLERTAGYYLPVITGACVAYARSVTQLAEDLQTVRPTILIAVPRIFERVYARIQGQMEKKSVPARALFQLAVMVGWQRFEQRQGRGRWAPAQLLWPILEPLVARKISSRLGGRLRVAVSGGAPLGTSVARLFIGLGIPVLQGYGLTETSPVISVNTLEDNDPASVGVVLPGIELRIGEEQELLVKSPGVMLGYWNNPSATHEVIDADGWLHTGDQARLDHGHVYITGRIKDILVLSNGEKVPPGDMEGAISLDALFEQVMIIGEGRPFLTAILVLNPDKWAELALAHGVDPEAREGLRDRGLNSVVINRVAGLLKGFPRHARVRRVILSLQPWTVDQGLMTPTLKVKRARVLARFAEQIEQIYSEGPAAR